MSRLAVCRFCGARGREEESDVAPGVCPSCLDERMARATEHFAANTARLGLGEALRRAHAEFVGFGMTEEASRAFLAQALIEGHRA